MKKNLFRGDFFLRFLCVCAAFVLNVGTVRAVDWASLGEAPVDGKKYYLYNPASGKFVSVANNKRTTDDPTEALLLTAVSSGEKFVFQFIQEGATKYLGYYSVANTDQYAFTCRLQNSGLYQLVYTDDSWASWGEEWIYQYYIKVNDSGSYDYAYSNGPTINNQEDASCNWAIISEETFNAQGASLYYAASGEANRGGSVKVAFENPVPEAATATVNNHTEPGFDSSADVTAYFKAIPDNGYEFLGWKESPTSEYVSLETTYSKTFTVNSTVESSPTTIMMYAYFGPVSNFEAQAYNAEGEEQIVGGGSFVDVLAYANNHPNLMVKLFKNVNLGTSAQTISQHMTIDFNGYTISGTASNILAIDGGANVTFVDNNNGTGGILVTTDAASEVSALSINSGTLTFSKGIIRAKNNSTEEGAKAVGVSLAAGATLNLEGGTIKAETGSDACGVKIPAGAYANLKTGAIEAKADNNAYGVTTSGTTDISWSVAITADATGGTNAVGVLANANTTISGGVITATAGSNAFGVQVQNGTTNISKNAAVRATTYALKQESDGVINVATGRFYSDNTQDITAATAAKLVLSGGYYVHDAGLSTYKKNSDVKQSDLKEGTKFYAEGYRYLLSDGDNPNYVVASAFGDDFIKYFSSLGEAISYANNNAGTPMTIRIEVPDCELSAGTYTIPANATLLIPYAADQLAAGVGLEQVTSAYDTPSKFCKLTLATGTRIDVFGTIEVGGSQYIAGQGVNGAGVPTGNYGWIDMPTGSSIVLSEGANLYAWGFITGSGSINVLRGASVYEQFQMMDWKGGTITVAMLDKEVFPVSSYFIQNVEVEATYHPGSNLWGKTGVNVSGTPLGANVQIIGVCDRLDNEDDDIAMFLMSDKDNSQDTWVKKSYNVATDYQEYDINSSARLGSIIIDFGNVYGMDLTFSSSEYVLPITSNLKIHLKTGEMNITQNTVMLPGSEIEIDKEATVEIGAGKALYLYDIQQWDKYMYSKYYAHRIKYRPIATPTDAVRMTSQLKSNTYPNGLNDASINIHGTFDVEGALYTTEGGANIYSTNEDAGTVHFSAAAAADGNVYQPHIDYKTHDTDECLYEIFGWCVKKKPALDVEHIAAPVTSAQLRNGDGTPTVTKGNAEAGDSYCYIDGAWKKRVADGCLVIDKTDMENWKYLAKPAEYVELNISEVITHNPGTDDEWHEYIGKKVAGEDTHLYEYYQADTLVKDTFLINMPDCQWWKVVHVEESDTIFHCANSENDKYYYHNGDAWIEKEFKITWINPYKEDKLTNPKRDTLDVYTVNYKSMPKYLGSTPQRAATPTYTYNFMGWDKPLVPVISDVTYVAQFQEKKRQYMITFKDEDGSVLEEKLWTVGEIPAPVNEPTPSGKILTWSPTIEAVSGEAVYTATYTDIVAPSYKITFKNEDGTILKQEDGETNAVYDVSTGEMPVYDGATPEKPHKELYPDKAFAFGGWTPDLVAVEGDAVYTATFIETPAKYTVTFKTRFSLDENLEARVDGEGALIAIEDSLLQTLEEVSYGITPVCTRVPKKASTAAEYYEVIWTPQIAAVTGNVTYTATGFAAHKNTCRLTVSAGPNGKVSMGGSEEVLSAIYEYGDEVEIIATATTEGYHFVRWSDGNTESTRTITVNATITLQAEFAINQYTIRWLDYDDSPLQPATTIVNYGETPSHSAPSRATVEGTIYTFAGWDSEIVPATMDKTYKATYNSSRIKYTVRLVLNNGMSDNVNSNYEYGDPVSVVYPVKASVNGMGYKFSGWKNTAETYYRYDSDRAENKWYNPATDEWQAECSLPVVNASEVYYAQYDAHIESMKAGNSEDANAKDLTISEDLSGVESLIIEPAGTVNITGSVAVQNFILESNGSQSGQLLGSSSDRLTINEHAYFDLTLNAQRRTWYAVAVPWAVDAENGISIKDGRKLVLGRDFDLVYYQGDVRASEGAGYQCWKYAEDADGDKIMHPGRAYMMYFGSEIETIRFENYDDTPFDDAVLTVGLYGASEAGDANWNGVANPRTYHATLAAGGATYGYYLNNGRVDEYMVGEGEPTYKLVNLASFNAIVGKPLFIQAVNTTPISTTPKIAAAPRRIREIEIEEGIETVYEVTFGAENSANRDNIFIQTVETKEDGYVIGQDLLKAGYNAKFPQMWVNRYGKRLSVNTATPENGVHEYPLVLNIPQAGDYTIAVEGTQGDTDALYLTKDGSIIWNLSNGAYIGSFEKGQETSYSLRTAAKAPTIATGMDEAVVDAQGATRKVLIDDQVFIIRGNNIYTIDGQLVK